MSAYEIPNLRFSGLAAAPVGRRRFVSVDANGSYVHTATGAANVIAVTRNEAKANEVLELADGIVIVEAAEAIAPNDEVQVGADGKAAKKSTGAAVAIALTKATAAGCFISIKL